MPSRQIRRFLDRARGPGTIKALACAYGASVAQKKSSSREFLRGVIVLARLARQAEPAAFSDSPLHRYSRAGSNPHRLLLGRACSRMGLARNGRLALRRFRAFAFGGVHAFLGGLLVARHGRGLGFFALVPRLAAVTATWRQAGVLGLDQCGLGDLVTASWRRVLATGALVAVGGRLMRRDQLVLARTDKVGTAHADQGLTQHWPAFGVVVAQESLVQATLLFALDDSDRVALVGDLTQRVLARVVHGGRGRHRRRIERLHLIGAETVALEPQGQVHHVFIGGAGVGGDEVRNQVLLLARFLGILLEHALELVIAANARLHHLVERTFLGVFRGDFQVATHVVGHQFLDVLRRLDRQVITQARSDEDLLHTRQGTGAAIQLDQRRVVGVQVRADAREYAGRLAARGFDFRGLARDPVHVGRRATEVGDDAGEAGHLVTNLFDFADDRLFGAVLDDPAFVLGNGAEGAAAEAATHDVHREADHVVGRNFFLAVRRVRNARIGHAEHVVHFFGGHGNGRRVEPDIHFTMLLHQRAGVARVGLQMQHAVGVSIKHGIAPYFFHGRQTNDGLVAGHARAGEDLHDFGFVWIFDRPLFLLDGAGFGVLGVHVRVDDLVDLARTVDTGGVHFVPALRRIATDERGAAYIGDVFDLVAVGQTLGDFDNGAFGVAVQQDVGAGVDQDRITNLVLPVVVVRDATQGRFDAAEYDRHMFVGFLAALAVDQAGAIRTLARHAARGIGVIGADFLVRGVAVDHRVHVASSDTEEQVRLAELHEVVFGLPVRLRNDPDAKALGLQQPANDRHAKRGVIHVRITGHDDDVAGIPAKLIHLLPAHGQEWRWPETLGPVLWIVE